LVCLMRQYQTENSLEPYFFMNPGRLVWIDELQRFLDSLDKVDKSISYVDYLKLVNYATNRYQPEYYALPEKPYQLRMLLNRYKTMLGHDMLKRFVSDDFSKVNVLLRTHISSSKDFLAAKKKIEKHLRENFPAKISFQVTGLGMVISKSSQLLTEGQIKSLALTLILVFTIMLLLFLSYKVGLIGILPNCFPVIVTFGLMGWLGIPLSVATSLIAGIAIGLAVDDTIHYLVKYNREFRKDLDRKRALQDTIQSVGRPIISTTLAIGVGFSVLMVSNFQPTALFGLMMVITMFSALVADLILLPTLMLHVELITVWDLLRLKLGKDPQKGIPLFDGLSRSQVHYILMAGTLRRFEDGEFLFRKGEVSDSMYAVISGEVEVVQFPEENPSLEPAGRTKQFINRIKPGEVVGEMGMIRACERSATVIAIKPSDLLEINDRMIKRLQWLYPPTAQKFFFNLMSIVCNRLEELTERHLKESVFDTLSGLYARDFFMHLLNLEIGRCTRYDGILCLFLVDIDNFSEINRVHGHQAGDFVLSETGKILSRHSRANDWIARIDANRFAGILPSIASEKGLKVCERLRETLVTHPFQFDTHSTHLSVSFGLASLSTGVEKDGAILLAEASRTLSHDKKTLGDRT
ncbi:diguanylate cyclase, partial [Thermodesulfobacteriota bacterium]